MVRESLIFSMLFSSFYWLLVSPIYARCVLSRCPPCESFSFFIDFPVSNSHRYRKNDKQFCTKVPVLLQSTPSSRLSLTMRTSVSGKTATRLSSEELSGSRKTSSFYSERDAQSKKFRVFSKGLGFRKLTRTT